MLAALGNGEAVRHKSPYFPFAMTSLSPVGNISSEVRMAYVAYGTLHVPASTVTSGSMDDLFTIIHPQYWIWVPRIPKLQQRYHPHEVQIHEGQWELAWTLGHLALQYFDPRPGFASAAAYMTMVTSTKPPSVPPVAWTDDSSRRRYIKSWFRSFDAMAKARVHPHLCLC
jgi:hypothetical protein